MQEKPHLRIGQIAVEVVDSTGVDRRGPADNTMHCVALGQEQFGETGTVLARDTGNERRLLRHEHSSLVELAKGVERQGCPFWYASGALRTLEEIHCRVQYRRSRVFSTESAERTKTRVVPS
jgi:hypothetical protein